MPSSDSEDFESADEGHSNVDKKERKTRLSSSNYSDNPLESEGEVKKSPLTVAKKETPKENTVQTDGWDDFDIDESEPIKQNIEENFNKFTTKEPKVIQEAKPAEKAQDSGWNDWGDWEDDKNSAASLTAKSEQQSQLSNQDLHIKDVTDRLAASTVNAPSNSGGWGWGWGVDSLISTATAGITNLTSQVSQGITTVLETGIGAPDPEELARKSVKENESSPKTPADDPEATEAMSSGDGAFQFGNLLKFVGDTGSKVITGGLDTLETIGRKTMEVLQDGDPGLAKKRALLGLDPDRPVLSQVLREAKAEDDDRVREEKREAKEVHYENLFDDFEGLVHLEALEMLSKQVSMRIEEQLRSASAEARQDMKETLQQVSELCEMPEEDEEEEEEEDEELEKLSKPDAFHERLQRATQDLGVKLTFHALVKQYTDILAWLSTDDLTIKALNRRAISSLAQATALSVEVYHKAAEMLLVKARRSTADEADALTQMTVALTKHTSDLATLFTAKLNSFSTPEDATLCNTYITNIFLEAGNSSTYIQNAFLLAQPIIQIGAV